MRRAYRDLDTLNMIRGMSDADLIALAWEDLDQSLKDVVFLCEQIEQTKPSSISLDSIEKSVNQLKMFVERMRGSNG